MKLSLEKIRSVFSLIHYILVGFTFNISSCGRLLFFIVCLISLTSFVFAQYSTLQNKEAFEKTRKWYTDSYYTVYTVDPVDKDANNNVTEAERMLHYSGIAEGIQAHTMLYRITKDKAYLIKAINKGTDLINKRTYYHTWSDFTEDEEKGYWYDGFPLAALAELAYIMISEPNYYPDIVNVPVPVALLTNQVPAGLPSSPTYGDFGSWLRDRVNETMTYYYTNYWADDAGWLFQNNKNT